MAQNNDSIITWSSFWSYFVSPSCDDEMRLEMAKDLRLADFLDNIPWFAQVEVLEDAPHQIISSESVWLVLKDKAKAQLAEPLPEEPKKKPLVNLDYDKSALQQAAREVLQENGWD